MTSATTAYPFPMTVSPYVLRLAGYSVMTVMSGWFLVTQVPAGDGMAMADGPAARPVHLTCLQAASPYPCIRRPRHGDCLVLSAEVRLYDGFLIAINDVTVCVMMIITCPDMFCITFGTFLFFLCKVSACAILQGHAQLPVNFFKDFGVR